MSRIPTPLLIRQVAMRGPRRNINDAERGDADTESRPLSPETPYSMTSTLFDFDQDDQFDQDEQDDDQDDQQNDDQELTPPITQEPLHRAMVFEDDQDQDLEQDDSEDRVEQEGGYIKLLTVLSLMTVKELMQLAKEYDIVGRSRMRKNQLIDALSYF
jgi:hypothetical protein